MTKASAMFWSGETLSERLQSLIQALRARSGRLCSLYLGHRT